MGSLAGVLWPLVLILPGWLLSPHSQEQRDVAAVYHTLAANLRAVGREGGYPGHNPSWIPSFPVRVSPGRHTALGRLALSRLLF
jgi:hypothetical protein